VIPAKSSTSYLRLGLNIDPAWIVAVTASIKVLGVLQGSHSEPNCSLYQNYYNSKCNDKMAANKCFSCGVKPFSLFVKIHVVIHRRTASGLLQATLANSLCAEN